MTMKNYSESAVKIAEDLINPHAEILNEKYPFRKPSIKHAIITCKALINFASENNAYYLNDEKIELYTEALEILNNKLNFKGYR